MLIKNISNIVNNKIDCNMLNNSNYISTENMLENFGGIKDASNVPSGKCTAILTDDILLSNIRPYFKKLWFSKLDGGCSNDVIALRVNNKLALSKYVFYALSSNKFFDVYVANCKGTKMPRGNKDVLLNYDIPTKSLSEQQHIVDTIGSVDDLIEKNEEIILKAHKLIDNIYLKETNTLELVKISELDYFNISKSGIKKFENNKIYLDTSAVSDTKITDESYIIDYENRPSRANMQPKENTIWFAKLKDSPKYILVKNQKRLLENFVFSTGFMGLESEEYIVNYLYALILSTSFTNQKNLLSNGATMQGINNEIFMNILVPNVDKTMAKLIGEKLENYVNLICRLQEKNYKLKQIKETLLQKYFG